VAIPSPPQQGIGRIAKVGREEVVGFVVALRRYLARDHAADYVRWRSIATTIADRSNGRGGVQAVVEEPAVTVPQAVIRFPGTTADAVAAASATARGLRSDDPRIFVGEDRVDDGELVIYVTHLTDGEAEIIVERLVRLLAG
jgi:D-glucosaminate-6-phosphate ammonia-lyase